MLKFFPIRKISSTSNSSVNGSGLYFSGYNRHIIKETPKIWHSESLCSSNA